MLEDLLDRGVCVDIYEREREKERERERLIELGCMEYVSNCAWHRSEMRISRMNLPISSYFLFVVCAVLCCAVLCCAVLCCVVLSALCRCSEWLYR